MDGRVLSINWGPWAGGGMVTEELSDDETLLAEDDLEEEEAVAPRRASAGAAGRRARVEVDEPAQEPGWVTAVAIMGALVLIYGLMVVFNIAAEQAPRGLTSIFATE